MREVYKMKRNPNRFAALGILTVVVLGCSGIKKIIEIVDENSKPKVVASTDNKVNSRFPLPGENRVV